MPCLFRRPLALRPLELVFCALKLSCDVVTVSPIVIVPGRTKVSGRTEVSGTDYIFFGRTFSLAVRSQGRGR
jgi:hypothetical protein